LKQKFYLNGDELSMKLAGGFGLNIVFRASSSDTDINFSILAFNFLSR
jgi:hypothetical protein